MQNSITHHQGGGVSFVGVKAVDTFRVAVLLSALGLLSKGITPTRGLTKTKAFKMASEYTGRKYKLTEFEAARADLAEVLAAKKAEIQAGA